MSLDSDPPCEHDRGQWSTTRSVLLSFSGLITKDSPSAKQSGPAVCITLSDTRPLTLFFFKLSGVCLFLISHQGGAPARTFP